MIPRTIHYCWFGRGEKPKLAKKCIESWKKFCPDYEIIEWNEDNFDVGMNAYTDMCYRQKKYAFLSDYARLIILKEYGGVYLDTDVEVVKPFDNLLVHKAFIGFETNDFVNTGQGFGAEPGAAIVRLMIAEYDDLLDGQHGIKGCPVLNTQALIKYGLVLNGQFQNIKGVAIYPADYFNPYDDPTGLLHKTKNTYSIHLYGKSWMSKSTVARNRISRIYHRIKEKF